jgi:outer membrane receptor protein involved in Fe transport
VTIPSWQTVDAHLSYAFNDGLRILGPGKTTINLNLSNLFDRAPPHVAPNGDGFSYDPVNASILGRVFALEIVKSW